MSTDKESNFLSVVVYLHGDCQGLSSFLGKMASSVDARFSAWELICVNDACGDEAKVELRKFAEACKGAGLSVVNLSFFHGIERAMRSGVDLAIGDFVCEVDYWRDGFSPQDVLDAYDKALEGYDMVGGSVSGSHRRGSGVFYRLFNATADLPAGIQTESFRILSRRLINRVKTANASIPYRKAAYASSGLPGYSIEVQGDESAGSCSEGTCSSRDRRFRRNLAVDTLILFTRTGYRIALGASLLMMLVALAGLVYSLVSYVNGVTVSGWTTIILFMAVSFFGLFGLMAIIIKYLQILVDLSFKKTSYEFSDVERL